MRTSFKPKQAWQIGNTVKVGFLSLEITGIDDHTSPFGHVVYNLKSSKGVEYTFSAYEGLNKKVSDLKRMLNQQWVEQVC